MRRTLEDSAGDVLDKIQAYLWDAADTPEPVLHSNSDGLVIEYNCKETGWKRFEKISDYIVENKS